MKRKEKCREWLHKKYPCLNNNTNLVPKELHRLYRKEKQILKMAVNPIYQLVDQFDVEYLKVESRDKANHVNWLLSWSKQPFYSQ